MNLGLSLARIRSFVAVVDEKQFRRAAERIGISQPALSAHLHELERYLGATLLSRTTRSVRLTAEGEKFLGRARNILSDLDAAVLEIRDHVSLTRGRVTVAAIPSAASQILPKAVARFTARYPGIEVQMIELGAGAVQRSVASGEVDFAISTAPDRSSELSFTSLMRDRFVGVVPCDHRLARRSRVRLREFIDHPLITTVQGTSIRTALERAWLECGHTLHVTHSVTQHHTVVAMVAAGLGVALLPSLIVSQREGVAVLTVVEPQITRDVGVIRRKGETLSSAAREFVASLSEG
jgi:LysR family transcriptional regulator, carnitine catabolism transcriptional activator